MMDTSELATDFKDCQKILFALGDETRQYLIFTMMQMGQYNGVRIGSITEKTCLSRQAISHHIRVLKEAGLIKVRHEETKNYYYFDPDIGSLSKLIKMLNNVKSIMEKLPIRNGE